MNIDLHRLHEAVVMACSPTPGHVVKCLLSFEVLISMKWQPPGSAPAHRSNWFVDISNQWERNQEDPVAHSREIRDWPHGCSLTAVEHLPSWCGDQVGVEGPEEISLLLQPL